MPVEAAYPVAVVVAIELERAVVAAFPVAVVPIEAVYLVATDAGVIAAVLLEATFLVAIAVANDGGGPADEVPNCAESF